MKHAAKEYIRERIEDIAEGDRDSWDIAYGMITLAFQLNLITDGERVAFLSVADHAYFWGKDCRSKV